MPNKDDNTAYPTGEKWVDAFWRTVIVNATHESMPAPPEYREHFVSYIVGMWWFLLLGNGWEPPLPRVTDLQEFVGVETESLKLFASALADAGYHKFFITKGGYIGLGPPGMDKNDVVCVLLGGHVPFLLRERVGNDDGRKRYTLVGECYVHGFVNGEGLDSEKL